MTIDSDSLPSLRRATAADSAAVGAIWRTGWHDAHDGHVADELVALRTDESFARRAAERGADTSVAVARGEVVGFVMIAGDEVEQVFVSRDARGSGIADPLL